MPTSPRPATTNVAAAWSRCRSTSTPGRATSCCRLHDAYALGGEDELRADLESAINLTIDSSKVMTADEFAAFLAGLPALQVDLPRDVLGADDAVLYPEGCDHADGRAGRGDHHDRIAHRAARRLRQPNIDALWSGIAAAVGTRAPGSDAQRCCRRRPSPRLATRLMAGPVASRGLVTRPLERDRNPEGLDIEELDRPDTVLVFASIAPAR